MIEEVTVGRWTPWCYYLCPVFLQGVLIMAKSSWIRSKKLALGIAVALGCSLMSVTSAEQTEADFTAPITGDIEKDVVPTAAPVRRQALLYPLRPFGEQKKHHIAALAHDVPRLSPPRVGFFQEEIRGHADPDLLTTLDFVVSGAVFLERVGKAAFRFVDLGPVLVPHPVEKIHVAVLAALAALDAAVPWIPDVVQEAHLLSVPIIIIAARTGNKSTPCTAPSDVIG